jgi:probable F420-dependent oxidoreductase
VVLAKEIATLDLLSGGRVTLGVGVGWLEEEFTAIGVPFAERGARTDDYIGALRALWRDDESSYHGRFVDFERVKSYPKPAQPGGVPIAIGGHTDAAARRAGRVGDEFFPGVAGFDRLRDLIEIMRASAVGAGRDPGAIGVTAAGANDADEVRRLAELGVTRIVVPNLGGDPERWKSRLGGFSTRVMAHIL